MQMLDHVLEFNPNNMSTINAGISYDIYPKLIRLMVNGNVIRPGEELDGKVILSKALSRTAEIDLDYNQNSVTLTFTALNYFRPQQTYYRVRINGLDEAWQVLTAYNSGGRVDSKGMLHLPMVALKPGTYNIEVQTSMIPDKWDTEPYMWVVNVHEPWWRASGMLMFLGGVLMVLLFANFMLYNRNTRLRVKRNSDEGDMVGRILNYADRCEAFESEIIGRECQEQELSDNDQQSELTKEFIDIMVIVLPYIKEQNGKFTIRELVDLTGTDVSTFYKVVSSSLYKNPRALVRVLRLMQVQELLRTTNKPLEDIVEQCHFASPNYMIATFYHQFKMTPRDYRLSI
jgi:AraC-like DNA-binding protein